MPKERQLLIISPDKAIWRFARSFRRVGWQVEIAPNLAAGMRLFEAKPTAYDLVIMDENHGCENGSFHFVLSGLTEVRNLNPRCKVFVLITLQERKDSEIKDLAGKVHAIITEKHSWPRVFARSARYFRYRVQ
ncbi:MAG: hypothetical protein ABIH38_02485 [Patescibacteria group bacterium]